MDKAKDLYHCSPREVGPGLAITYCLVFLTQPLYEASLLRRIFVSVVRVRCSSGHYNELSNPYNISFMKLPYSEGSPRYTVTDKDPSPTPLVLFTVTIHCHHKAFLILLTTAQDDGIVGWVSSLIRP